VQRISVLGSSGSGKTTVARRVAAELGLPVLELDSVYHQPDWEPLDDESFRERVGEFTLADRWVVDGNYTSHGVAEVVWPRADTVIWIDLPRWVTTRQVIRRTLRRAINREELWNGNKEPLTNFYRLDPEKNVIVWSWTRHGPTRDKYESCLADGTWDHLQVIRLQTKAEVGALMPGP
jgi:adenylate kinase family enzyme